MINRLLIIIGTYTQWNYGFTKIVMHLWLKGLKSFSFISLNQSYILLKMCQWTPQNMRSNMLLAYELYKTQSYSFHHLSKKNVLAKTKRNRRKIGWQKCSQNYEKVTKTNKFHLKIGNETRWLRTPFVMYVNVCLSGWQVTHRRRKNVHHSTKTVILCWLFSVHSNWMFQNSDEIITFH